MSIATSINITPKSAKKSESSRSTFASGTVSFTWVYNSDPAPKAPTENEILAWIEELSL
jgi:hypothetical protein